jgi:hypothetical protein
VSPGAPPSRGSSGEARRLVNRVAPDQVTQTLGISRDWLDLRRWAIVRQIVAAEGHSRG